MNQDATTVLSISKKYKEFTPDRITKYFTFDVRVNSKGFTGSTTFDAAEHSIKEFVQQLQVFYTSLTPDPEFVTGWGSDVYFALKFSRLNLQGHIAVDCEIKEPGLESRFNCVHIYEAIEVYQIAQLIQFLKGVLSDGSAENVNIQCMSS